MITNLPVGTASSSKEQAAVPVSGRVGASVARIARDHTSRLRQRLACSQLLSAASAYLARASSLSPPAHLLYQMSVISAVLNRSLTILLSRLDLLAKIHISRLHLLARGSELLLRDFASHV